MPKILFLQPSSPPLLNVMRDFAGGYGVAGSSTRKDYGHEGGVVPYVSLLYSAGIMLKAGYPVSLIDGQAENLNLNELLKRIKAEAPQIIVNVINLPSIAGDLHLLEQIHKVLPSIKIVSIGTTCKSLYEIILRNKAITAVVVDDPEVVVKPLIEAILSNSDLANVPGIVFCQNEEQIIKTSEATPLSDLNGLPIPPYHLLPIDRYWHGGFGEDARYMEILDSRGCPYQCRRYCPYPYGFGRKTLFRDPQLVVDELEYLLEEFNVDSFIFRGQTFTMRRQHAEMICNKIIDRGLKIRWLCETRLDCVDRDILHLMKSAGCERVHYGLESGDPNLLKNVGKPGCSLEELKNSVTETKNAGLIARVNVVIGLPGENWTTIKQTIQTLRNWRPDEVLAAIITPYPGTPLYAEVKEKGFLVTSDWDRFTGFHPVMRTEYLSTEDLISARDAIENCLNEIKFQRRVLNKATGIVRNAVVYLRS